MFITVPRETHPWEPRVPLMPDQAAKLVQMGADVAIEAGLARSLHLPDAAYETAGARIADDRASLFQQTGIMLKLRPPFPAEIELLPAGAVYIGLLDPFNNRGPVESFAGQGITVISMEMIPRSTRAQKMDVLSSQANLAGYAAVMVGADRLGKILPMMMTPAGTISPTRVFVIGAGVAGLQAIATARRLGARVEAFDTRPAVEEQVRSLGARFVQIDIGPTGETREGYAKRLTDEQLGRQREGMARICASSDLVITTAQLFGRPAPLIVTRKMIEAMQPGSVIVDLAVESGGNVDGVRYGEEVVIDGVTVVGLPNLAGRVPVHASQMLSANFFNFLAEFWDPETQGIKIDTASEIMKGCLITHQKAVVNDMLTAAYG